jgi:endonuclease III
MEQAPIQERLIEQGKVLFAAPPAFHRFTGDAAADNMMNDLASFPHAFVLGCVMDRQIKAEKAWVIPYKVKCGIGSFSMQSLTKLSAHDIRGLMSKPEKLHRFVDVMSKNFYLAIQKIWLAYEGDASRIWSGRPSSAEVVYRFLEFEGVGPKIATMAANILARTFKIQMSDYSSIDVSVDVHVRRVFGRLGLCGADASVDQIIYKARALHPEFPGIIDSPSFEIGRKWCRATGPLCDECIMNDVCPTGARKISSNSAKLEKRR